MVGKRGLGAPTFAHTSCLVPKHLVTARETTWSYHAQTAELGANQNRERLVGHTSIKTADAEIEGGNGSVARDLGAIRWALA
jgi:hypothetical protein